MSRAIGTERANRHRARGFTLVEVLVCLFVVGLIGAILLALIDIQSRRAFAMGVRSTGDESVMTAQTLLRGRLESMRAVADPRTAGERLAMYGSLGRIDFQAPQTASRGPHSLHSFRLQLGRDKALMLYSTSLHGTADPFGVTTEGWESLRLAENVERMEITYFGYDKVTRRDAWQERWEAQSELPKLVRIEVSFAAGDPRFWPVLMAKPSPQLRLGCTADDKNADC